MIGDRAVVVSVKGNEAEVEYQCETWRAVSPKTLNPGQQVVIEGVDGLTLRVALLEGSAGG